MRSKRNLKVRTAIRAAGIDVGQGNHNRRALRLPSGLTGRQALDRLLRAVADPVRRAVRG